MADTPDSESRNVARLLERWSGGDRQAFDELLTHLYRDIRAIAVRELRNERHSTIQPTVLGNETYLRMVRCTEMRWQDRAHFLAMAARVTRQVLVDEARRRRADKRSGGTPFTLTDSHLATTDSAFDAIEMDALLTELHSFDDHAAEVVSLRVFGGLSAEEAAEVLGISLSTVQRRWIAGKAWLAHELRPGA